MDSPVSCVSSASVLESYSPCTVSCRRLGALRSAATSCAPDRDWPVLRSSPQIKKRELRGGTYVARDWRRGMRLWCSMLARSSGPTLGLLDSSCTCSQAASSASRHRLQVARMAAQDPARSASSSSSGHGKCSCSAGVFWKEEGSSSGKAICQQLPQCQGTSQRAPQ